MNAAGGFDLEALGWDEGFAAALAASAGRGQQAGRVLGEYRGGFRVATAEGEVAAEVSGKMRYDALDRSDMPVVGDWVALSGRAIQAVLARRSVFRRLDPGGGEQLLAANVDLAFLVMSLNRDFNLRRLERYLTVVWSSGARPVVILSKADLVTDLERRVAEVRLVAAGAPVLAVSVPLSQGLDDVRSHLAPARTAVFLGSSGVGKSTLIYTLAGRARQAVAEIRGDDDRGRHTTTGRELITLPGGWLVIDTPGLRGIGLTDADIDAGLDRVFADIDELAATCRFGDCSHENEPGCAVRAAVDEGRLDPDRLASHRKLQREAERASIATVRGARAANRSKWRAIVRSANQQSDRRQETDR
jgi:ribosome biogenesis GTPase